MQDIEPTSVETVEKAAEIAKSKGIKYVYLGNVHSGEENTVCPVCGYTVIRRKGFSSETNGFNGVCGECGFEINGVW